jgi:DNA-binding CsgD family transcriptional regulator
MVSMRDVVGREAELAAVLDLLEAAAGRCRALLIEGEPGIGKSTIWSAALAAAADRGFTVLSCRCAQPEVGLSFSGLADLTEPVLDRVLPRLPAPQARALEIALIRVEPTEADLDQRAVLLGFLSVLRQLSADAPVLLALDDLQWVDPATARVVEFACRRLQTEPVGIVMSMRVPGEGPLPLDPDRSLADVGPSRLHVGPLAMGAIARIVRDQAGVSLSRPLLRRIHETTGGNPFYALELARALDVPGPQPAIDDPLPVPAGLRQLVQARLAGLPATARDLLLLAAAGPHPTVALLAEAVGGEGVIGSLRPAIDQGIAEADDHGCLSFAHPLWAAAAYSAAPSHERQHAHERLAAVAADPETRARHLARAAERPSEQVASALTTAARGARARGATHAAAEYAALAARLTPDEDRRWQRRIEAAEYLFHAGDAADAARLLEALIAELPPGQVRARARIALGRVRTYNASNWAATEVLAAALEDAAGDPLLQAEIHQSMAWICDFDLSEGLRHADAAAALLERAGQPALLAGALGAKLWFGFLLGHGLRMDLAERAEALERQARSVRAVDGIELPLGALLKSADRLPEARTRLENVLRAATAEQDDSSRFEVMLELGHLECLAGRWPAAERYAGEVAEFVELTGQDELRSAVLALSALVNALLGRLDLARAQGGEGLRLAQASRAQWFELMNLPVLGLVELSAGRPEEAAAHLARADELCERIALREPGRFRFHADYIEALVALGELDRAADVLARFTQRGQELGRIWAQATSSRCRGLLLAARGDQVGAAAALQAALRDHERLPMPFEQARTFLAAGQVHRRARRKREARDMLTAAQAQFASLGATVWAARAGEALGRVGLRAAPPLDLTPTERGAAELAAAGLTNREIAERMFISLRTAESTLSRVYRKLGVRSRAELARDYATRMK